MNQKSLKMRTLALAAYASVAMAVPGAASVVGVPAPVIEVNGAAGNFGTYVGTGTTLTLTSQPGVTITADATGLGPNDSANEYGTSAYVEYFVVVTGGEYGDLVPLLVTGSLNTSASAPDGGDVSYGTASIGLSFFNGNYGASENVSCGNLLRGEDCSDPTWSGTLAALAAVGYNNVIEISATAVVESSGSAHAFADPYVQIDPAFLATHPGYDLTLNVGNTATEAPEPASIFLAGSCLAILVSVRKRRFFKTVR